MVDSLLSVSPFLGTFGTRRAPGARKGSGGGRTGDGDGLGGAEILPYRPPQQRSEATAKLGMIIFLGSWAMMFGALFFAYGVLRTRAAVWPPVDQPRLPLAVGIVNTLVLALSSGSLFGSLWAIRRNAVRLAAFLLLGAGGLGAAFLGLQMRSWSTLSLSGFTPSSSTYASVFYGLTWLHAAHVAVGVVALLFLGWRAWRKIYSAPRHLPLRLWAMYWHFVGAMWGLMFVLLYLV